LPDKQQIPAKKIIRQYSRQLLTKEESRQSAKKTSNPTCLPNSREDSLKKCEIHHDEEKL